MNKLLRSSLMLLCLTLTGVPGAARAGGGYLPLAVPELPQAVVFFHAVLNCALLSEDAASGSATVALQDCGDGSIVELSAGASRSGASRLPHATAAAAPAPALATRDAVAAAAWLRANHVRVVGQPRRIAEGRGASRTVVTFVTPWGQPLQLVSDTGVSEIPPHITTAGLAVQ